ncbi:hypothetical protein STEG23_031470, partial [Scotinomys teguina]
VQTAVDCGSRSRKEEDNVSVISSQPEGSLQSWMSCSLSLATGTVRTPSRQSAISSPRLSPRENGFLMPPHPPLHEDIRGLMTYLTKTQL